MHPSFGPVTSMARFLLHLLLFFSSLFFDFTASASASASADNGTRAPDFSAVLYFGDSTLDTGNNGYILTLVRGNHSPYGRDFPGSVATGRLSNGLLVPDLLCSELEIKQLSPPFMDPNLSDDDIRTGVNFASAGSGFDDATSALLNTIPISRQSEMFEEYLARLKAVAGEEDAKRIVSDALFLVSAGTNDFLLNYYDLPTTTRTAMTIDEYQDFLLQNLHKFLKDSYDLGGRRFIVAGLPPIGCLPLQMTLNVVHSVVRTCVDEQNSDARHYNSKLKHLLLKTQQSLPGSKFAYLDLYDFLMEVLNNAAKYGFQETKRGCCGTGLLEVGPLCNRLNPACPDASRFVFYDAIHPSQRFYELITDYIVEDIIPHLRRRV